MAPTSVGEIGKNAKNPKQDLGMLYNVLFLNIFFLKTINYRHVGLDESIPTH
jgi:hypothetical protein